MEASHADRTRVLVFYGLIGTAFLLIAVLASTLLYVSSLQNEVQASGAQIRAACGRGNVIRGQVNYDTSVLRSFLAQAAATRELTAQHADAQRDPVAARINRDAAAGYRALAGTFSQLTIIDCENLR